LYVYGGRKTPRTLGRWKGEGGSCKPPKVTNLSERSASSPKNLGVEDRMVSEVAIEHSRTCIHKVDQAKVSLATKLDLDGRSWMMAVGIDIAKAKFDAAVLLEGKTAKGKGGKIKHKVFENHTKGFEGLLSWLSGYSKTEIQVCMEATNSYSVELASFMSQQGYAVSIVNPAKIKAYAQSQLARNKTDKLDWVLIAQFCLDKQPRLWQTPTPELGEFQAVVRRWETLKDITAQELNRLDSESIAVVQDLIGVHISYLDQQIDLLETTVDALIQIQPQLHTRQQLLQSIPGIGKITAYGLLAEVPFDFFEHPNQLLAFAGLNPKQHSSGTFKGSSPISKMGSARLRKMLYFPAISAKRFNPLIRPLASRLHDRGHVPLSIICAAMRKLLHLAFAVIKSGKPFDPEYLDKRKKA
jgi:transposase